MDKQQRIEALKAAVAAYVADCTAQSDDYDADPDKWAKAMIEREDAIYLEAAAVGVIDAAFMDAAHTLITGETLSQRRIDLRRAANKLAREVEREIKRLGQPTPKPL